MKKTYIIPRTEMIDIQLEGLLALSMTSDPADSDPALVKERNEWDIWGNSND